MAVSNVRKIAAWEALQVLRSKVFIISVFAIPLILRLFLLPGDAGQKHSCITVVVGILDESGSISSRVFGAQIPFSVKPGYNFLFVNLNKQGAGTEKNLAQARNYLSRRAIDAYLYVSANHENTDFYSSLMMPEELIAGLKQAILTGASAQGNSANDRLNTAVNSMRSWLNWNNQIIPKEDIDKRALGALIMIILLFASLGLTGNWFLRAFVEEKNNRLLEVLLGSCRVTEILWGKFAGLLAVAILQLIAMTGLFVLSSFGNIGSAILIISSGWSLALFAAAVLFFLSLYMLVGIVSRNEIVAQSIGMLVGLSVMLPAGFVMPHFYTNSQAVLHSLLYVPVLSPGVGFVLLQDGTLSPVGCLLIILLLLCCFLLAMWYSSRVFVKQIAQPAHKEDR